MGCEMNQIVFDVELRRPACVLLQAAYGVDSSVVYDFPANTWLTFPTKGMRVYEATDEQIEKLIEISTEAVKGKTCVSL